MISEPWQVFGATPSQWQDWRWHLRHRITHPDQLPSGFRLSPSEEVFFQSNSLKTFPFQLTPYYLSLINPQEPDDPVRLMAIGRKEELEQSHWGWLDPLGESAFLPKPRLVHRYPDRVLVWVTDQCSVYCRFCFRRHFTGQNQGGLSSFQLREIVEYLKQNGQVKEVILTGGDALLLSDERLATILNELRQVPHIRRIRLATRMPVVCPMRITDGLVQILQRYRPIFIMTHFNHPHELTDESRKALIKLTHQGIPVFNQTVLLNGVNSHPAVIGALWDGLLDCQVKPYYLFQCDPAQGIGHFLTPLWVGAWVLGYLWGCLSTLGLPQWAAELAGQGSKVWLHPDQFRQPGPNGSEFWQWKRPDHSWMDSRGVQGQVWEGRYLRFPVGWWGYQKVWLRSHLWPLGYQPQDINPKSPTGVLRQEKGTLMPVET